MERNAPHDTKCCSSKKEAKTVLFPIIHDTVGTKDSVFLSGGEKYGGGRGRMRRGMERDSKRKKSGPSNIAGPPTLPTTLWAASTSTTNRTGNGSVTQVLGRCIHVAGVRE